MVKITPEEVIRRRQLEQASVDELNDLDRVIVGDVARLEVPLRSVVALRRVAEHLRGLASMLDQASRRDDLPARSVLFEVRMQVRAGVGAGVYIMRQAGIANAQHPVFSACCPPARMDRDRMLRGKPAYP